MRAVQAQPAALEVDQRHADRRVVEGAAEELLGGAQRVLDAARLGDVLAGAVDETALPSLVERDLAARVDHPHVAVGAHDPVVEVPGAAVGDAVLDRAGDAGAVVRVDALEVTCRTSSARRPRGAGRRSGRARRTR